MYFNDIFNFGVRIWNVTLWSCSNAHQIQMIIPNKTYICHYYAFCKFLL